MSATPSSAWNLTYSSFRIQKMFLCEPIIIPFTMGIVVVVPTYKEEGNVGPLISRIKSFADALHQNKGDVVAEYDIGNGNSVLLLHSRGRRGLGCAYKSGFRYALNNPDSTTFIQMDGDLQHPPEKIPELLRLLRQGYDVVIASRYIKGSVRDGLDKKRELLSRSTNYFISRFLGLGVNDATSGFRAMSRKAAESVACDGIAANGFAFQVEALNVLKKRGMKIEETSFCFGPRMKGRSKLFPMNPFDFIRSVVLSKLRHF